MSRTDRWLAAWGTSSVALGGASLIVPLYVVELGGTAYTLGIMAALAAFVGVPGALVAGPLADRQGRHRFLVLAALGAVTIALLAIPVLESLPAIIVANALVWLAFASALPVLTLLAVANVPEAEWTDRIARLNTYQGAGWAMGLVLGAVASAVAARWLDILALQRTILVGYAILAGVGLLAGTRWLPAPAADDPLPDPRRLRRAITRASRFNVRGVTFPITPTRVDVRGLHPGRFVDRFTPPLALYFIALFLGFAGFAAFFAPLPAFLRDASFGDGEIFALYVVSSLASAACFGATGRLAASRGPAGVQVGGLAVRGVAFPAVAGAVSLLGATALGVAVTGSIFVLIGISWALIIVTAGILVTTLSPPTIRGEALGIYSALMAFAGGVGSIVGGRLALSGYLVAFGAAGGLVTVGAVVVVLVAWRRGGPAIEGAAREDPHPRVQDDRP